MGGWRITSARVQFPDALTERRQTRRTRTPTAPASRASCCGATLGWIAAAAALILAARRVGGLHCARAGTLLLLRDLASPAYTVSPQSVTTHIIDTVPDT